ncbi:MULTISPECIES: hypothetical protein [Mycobacteriaceae]|uniref:hypothetical protein n=1 Tax=Mycobacteriaceae TaxID=1762 RepID=UPI0009D69F70|nr:MULTISPECIES: hypothetical protein [Mycolicibacterium]
MTDAVIVDVDGTLCDVSSVRHFVAARPKDFDAFHSAAETCPPHTHVLDEVRELLLSGVKFSKHALKVR